MTQPAATGAAARWLMFVEDPGAAIYARFLPAAAAQRNIELTVIATGHAAPYFEGASRVWNEALDAAQVMETLRPQLVLLGTSENPDTFAFALREAAARRQIPTVGIVDAIANAAERFKGRTSNALSHMPDWLIVPDEPTASEFVALGVDGKRIQTCGHPQFDNVVRLRSSWNADDRRNHRERWLPEAAAGRKILVFVSEISTGLNAGQFERSPDYTLEGRPGSDYRTEVVIDALTESLGTLPTSPYLVLRLHPKQLLSDLPRHHTLFDQISKTEPALELVNAADMVVGMTSMLLLEAALLGRPTLSVVPRPEERRWLGPLGESIPCAWTQTQLNEFLPALLTAGSHKTTATRDAETRVMEFLTGLFR